MTLSYFSPHNIFFLFFFFWVIIHAINGMSIYKVKLKCKRTLKKGKINQELVNSTISLKAVAKWGTLKIKSWIPRNSMQLMILLIKILVHDGSKSFLYSPNIRDFNYSYNKKRFYTSVYTHVRVKLRLGLPQPCCFQLSPADTLWVLLCTGFQRVTPQESVFKSGNNTAQTVRSKENVWEKEQLCRHRGQRWSIGGGAPGVIAEIPLQLVVR